MDTFSQRFKELKTEKDLTFGTIAKQLGIDPRSVQSYASGQSKPTYWGFLKLADLFDVSLDYLAGRSDER